MTARARGRSKEAWGWGPLRAPLSGATGAAVPHPAGITRRDFAAAAATATATAMLATLPASAAQATPAALIDTNVSLGRWPFRRCPLDETSALVDKLSSQGVTQAWAGSFDAMFHKDLSAVNRRLAEECRLRGRGLLIPFGAVNPALPGWEEDLRQCRAEHGMPGIRLLPNYHGYSLDTPAFADLLKLAAANRLVVQIACGLEDQRTQSPRLQFPPVDVGPIPDLLSKLTTVRVQLLNAFRSLRGKPVLDLAAHGARFEIATLEGVEGVSRLLAQIPADRLCFGSHAPFFYFESAKLKLRESVLDATQLEAVLAGNARRLLASA